MDLISVILPVYNVAPYLRKSLDSVLKQTYENLEILLIDDGSTDESSSICDEYALKHENIRVIHKENGGVSSARNLGIKESKGEYVTFVDSDDLVEPDMIEKMHRDAINNDVLLSCCQLNVVEINGKTRTLADGRTGLYSKDEVLNGYFTNQFIKEQFYGPCNKLFHKTIINQTFFKPYKLGEDILFILEVLLKVDKVYISNHVGYHYMHREGSATTSNFSKKRLDYIYAGEEMQRICQERYPQALPHVERWLFFSTVVTLREINMAHIKKECPAFYGEHKAKLLKQKRLFAKLPFMRKLDYLGIMLCPLYFRILKAFKG